MITQAKREGVLADVNWDVEHANLIGYWQARPMRTIPMSKSQWQAKVLAGDFKPGAQRGVDCSEYITDKFFQNEIDDPNHQNYNGIGNTQYMLNHLPHISWAEAHLATIVVCTAGPLPTQHGVIVLEPNGNNPLVGSMGGNNGPIKIYLQTLLKYLPGRVAVPLGVSGL
jgi:hypothetical protein